MERLNSIDKENVESIIKKIFCNRASEVQFCHDFISLDVDDNFDDYMSKNSNMAEMFDLCVRYLDKDEHNKEHIWGSIESKVAKL